MITRRNFVFASALTVAVAPVGTAFADAAAKAFLEKFSSRNDDFGRVHFARRDHMNSAASANAPNKLWQCMDVPPVIAASGALALISRR